MNAAEPAADAPDRVVAEVDLSAIRSNVRRLDEASGDAALMIVVKADGYGHGMVEVARAARAAGAAWLFLETMRPQQELAKTETERATQESRERESPQQVADERQPSERPPDERERAPTGQQNVTPSPTPRAKAAPAFASLTLTVGGTRSTDPAPPAVLVIPARTEQVRLRLNLREHDYTSYRAALQAAGGEEIYTWGRLKSGASLTLIIPARRFADGDYILTLRGVSESGEVEDVSKSLFRVERK